MTIGEFFKQDDFGRVETKSIILNECYKGLYKGDSIGVTVVNITKKFGFSKNLIHKIYKDDSDLCFYITEKSKQRKWS